MKRVIILIFVFFKFFMGSAQSIKITGAVIDSVTKQGLPNATVVISNNNNYTITVLSNKKAVYNTILPAKGFYTIEANYVGYKKQTIDSFFVDENHTVIHTIFLSVEKKYLDAVSINAKKPFIVMGTNKIILNVAQSPIAAGGNAYEVLLRAPGVLEQSDVLNFRGKSVNILINGRPTNLTGEDLKTMLTNMQANNIDRVEILPNPSARYDAQGGSVINIVLNKNKSYGTNYVLTTTVGTGIFLRGSTGLDFNNRNKKINIYGGYTYANNRQYFINASTRYLGNANLSSYEYDQRVRNNHSYKLGLDYDINKKSTIGFLINGYKNHRDRTVENAATLHFNGNNKDSVATVNTVGKAVVTNPSLNLFYKTTLDTAGKELTINADYIDYNKAWSDNFVNNFYDENGRPYLLPTLLRDNSPAKINVYSFTIDLVLPTKKAKWEMGLKTNYTTTDNDVLWENNFGTRWVTDKNKTNHFIYKENVNAGYVNYLRTIKKYNLDAGLRIEQTNNTGNSITANQVNKNSYTSWFPTVGLEYAKNEKNTIGFNYRKSIVRFGFDYVNPFIIYQNQYAYSQGNPAILPQINHAFELSYLYKQTYSLSLAYVHGVKSLGEVYLQAPNNVTVSTYGNFKSNDVFYLSGYGSKKLFKKWTVTLNPSVGYISQNNASNKIALGNNKKIVLTQLNWQNSFSFKKGITAELNFVYLGPYQYGSYTTKIFFNSSVGISKPIFKNKVTAKLGVTDIFNTLNSNRNLDYDGIKTTMQYKAESRFVNLTLRYKFGNKNVKAKARNQSKTTDVQNRIK